MYTKSHTTPTTSTGYSETQCTKEIPIILEDPRVHFLLYAIRKRSQKTLVKGITCRSCVDTVQSGRFGYYDPQNKRYLHLKIVGNVSLFNKEEVRSELNPLINRIVICCEAIHSQKDLEETVIHELVHAYDAGRKGNFTTPCHNVACSEIRASALGQCANVWPLFRKRECTRREAINSTLSHCKNAEQVVNEVFDKCFKDTSPFPPS
ncbi:Mitochondrial inner membrane protease ATP23 [Basidiobolus ranarum]|uniref:Mitochondrial inner membrane protease ATP23 n=1 Tax=Basidiobolus ranarum TaxID=34480 RepID=A0ABR2WK99_9FUNG